MVCQLTLSGIEEHRTWALLEELPPTYNPELPPSLPQRAPTTDHIDFYAEVKECPCDYSSYQFAYGKLHVHGHSVSVVCKYVVGTDRKASIRKLRDEAQYYLPQTSAGEGRSAFLRILSRLHRPGEHGRSLSGFGVCRRTIGRSGIRWWMGRGYPVSCY